MPEPADPTETDTPADGAVRTVLRRGPGMRSYVAADGRFEVRAETHTTIPSSQRPNRRRTGGSGGVQITGWIVHYPDGARVWHRTLRDVRDNA